LKKAVDEFAASEGLAIIPVPDLDGTVMLLKPVS
jgi:hypothetical protein